MCDLHGVFPALVTPFDTKEKINYDELERQINRQIAAGVDGIFVMGTNGEFYALSYNERVSIMDVAINAVRKRVPIMIGAGAVTTAETVNLSIEAQRRGADAISVITPYFIGTSQSSIKHHYMEVARQVDIPMMLYTIPQRTGNTIEKETVVELSSCEVIIGIKDSSGSWESIQEYLTIAEKTGNTFDVFVGPDSLIKKGFESGCKGCISGIANIIPERIVDIYQALRRDEHDEAARYQEDVNTIRSLFTYGNPNSIVKRAVVLLGYDVGPCRQPGVIDDKDLDSEIIAKLSFLGLIPPVNTTSDRFCENKKC